MSATDEYDDEGFYDDSGRWWPQAAEWCDRCQGMGTAECLCGGDQCYCQNGGEIECSRCDGQGYFVPTPAFIAARQEAASWWQDLHEAFRDRDGAEGGDANAAPVPQDRQARAEGIAQTITPPQSGDNP